MGLLSERGLGGPKDANEAFKWFTRAAELHHTRAMLSLGEMYWKGVGVKQDKVAAYKWIFISAGSGVAEAKTDQDALEKEMDPGQIKKAKADAIHWVNTQGLLLFRKFSN